MDRQVESRRGALVPTATGLATTGSHAASTAPVAFEGEVVTWAQLPARTRRVARRRSPVVAEAVEQHSGVEYADGRAVERATGWRVHEDAVVLADVLRPVAPASAGGLRPVGPWEHRQVWVHTATGPARRRRGVVDVADELDAPELGLAGPRSSSATAEGAVEGVWRHLPRVVRAAAERLVPVPVAWLGELVQLSSPDGFPLQQDVRCLRLSGERAVVVLATRTLSSIPGAGVKTHVSQMARIPWIVEQVGLELGSPQVRRQLGRT